MAVDPSEPADSTATAASGVLVSRASRALRRSLTPLEWVVLEDVSLDAVEDEDGGLVAATSARQVAEHLGISPGSAAKALSRLRSLGLVTHDRQPGPAGRFGLSLYRLVPPPGVEVVTASGSTSTLPRTGAPRAESPGTATPRTAEAHMADEDRPVTAAATRPTRSVRRPGPVQEHQQLDLLAPASTIDQHPSQPNPAPTPHPSHTRSHPPNQHHSSLLHPFLQHPNPNDARHLPALRAGDGSAAR